MAPALKYCIMRRSANSQALDHHVPHDPYTPVVQDLYFNRAIEASTGIVRLYYCNKINVTHFFLVR